MTSPYSFKRCASLLAAAVFATACCLAPATLYAQESPDVPASGQQTFSSPDEAVNALRAAITSDDEQALEKLFGPELKSLRTGDKVEDAKHAHKFATAMQQSCHLDRQSDNKIFVAVGTNDWPMPIPLTRANGQWFFDTPAGKEEIIDRHIGKDELAAIGVCRGYVLAQKEYARMNGGMYAQKFKSSPDGKNGLYWPTADNQPASPFGPQIAEADVEGDNGDKGPQSFHGYFFKILTRQGSDAPGGKMDYMMDGDLKGGFALVAYPEHWDQSGIMTFIVNQNGQVYQRDLGEKSVRIGAKMKEYDPDSNWSLVRDQGLSGKMFGE